MSEPKPINHHLNELRKAIGLPDQQPEPTPQAELDANAKEYFKRLNSEKQYPNLTYNDLLKKVHDAGYIVDDDNKRIVTKLCLYFSNDPRMCDLGLEPQKGIALIGGVGVGKTMLMKILRYNSHLPFGIVDCHDICDKCEQGGSEDIKRYMRLTKTERPDLYYGKNEIGFCFNELGRERIPTKYFGNDTNVMERILFDRYEKQIPYNFTHFTSNFSPSELDKKYGDYIRDRMKEMFNRITFPQDAKSRRK